MTASRPVSFRLFLFLCFMSRASRPVSFRLFLFSRSGEDEGFASGQFACLVRFSFCALKH